MSEDKSYINADLAMRRSRLVFKKDLDLCLDSVEEAVELHKKTVSISVSLLSDVVSVVQELRNRGFTLDVIIDQRDGDFITISWP